MNRPTYPDTREGVLAFIHENVDARIVTKVEAGLKDRTLALVPDPEVEAVWGLCVTVNGNVVGNGTVAVFYLAQADFEMNEAYFGWV